MEVEAPSAIQLTVTQTSPQTDAVRISSRLLSCCDLWTLPLGEEEKGESRPSNKPIQHYNSYCTLWHVRASTPTLSNQTFSGTQERAEKSKEE